MDKYCPDCRSNWLTKQGSKWTTLDGKRVRIRQFQCQKCGRMTGYPVNMYGDPLPPEVVSEGVSSE